MKFPALHRLGHALAALVIGHCSLVTPALRGQVSIAWGEVSKTGSSLADLTTRSASDLTTGTLLAGRLPAFTGDLSTPAGSTTTTLATVNASPGSFGSATQSLTATVNAKGLITALSAQTITPAWTSITSRPTTLSGYNITDAQPLDSDLTAFAANSTPGLWAYTGAGTGAARTISGTAPITVTNGAGTAGNPTIAITAATETAAGALRLATAAEAGALTDNATAMSPLDVAIALAGRPASPWIYSDGATPNRGVVYGPFSSGSRGWIAGAAVLDLLAEFDVPTSNPASTMVLYSATPDLNAPLSQSNFLHVSMEGTTSNLRVRAHGAVSVSDRRTFLWSDFLTTYSGRRIKLRVLITQGTSNPRVWVDGVEVTANFGTPILEGAPPPWLAAAMVPTYQLVGNNWPAGAAPVVVPILGQLTAAEHALWVAKGTLPAWVAPGGLAPSLIPSSFSASSATINSQSAGNVDFTVTGSPGQYGIRFGPDLSPNRVGGRLRVTFSAAIRSSTGLNYVRVMDRSNNAALSNFQQITNGSNSIAVDVYAAGVQPAVEITGFSSNIDAAITNISSSWNGALTLPAVQTIPVLDDLSGIGNNQGRMIGMVPVGVTSPAFRLIARTATSGNESLLGGPVFDAVNRYRINAWTIANLGAASRTVSLGNISTGTQYGSALTVPVGLTEVTPTTRYNATLDLWANSNGTDPLLHTITGQRIGNN